MRKLWIGILILMALLLAACQAPAEDPVETSSQAVTTAPTTTPEETTAAPGLSAEDCLLPEWDRLSYEDFFAEDRPFAATNQSDWFIPQGDTYIRYRAVLDGTVLTVQSDAEEAVYTVPCQLQPGFYLLAADGNRAYLRGLASVIQVDLRTGVVEPLTWGDEILDAVICGRDVLYYAVKNEDSISIRREYIPTGQNDLLYGDLPGNVPSGNLGFSLGLPQSTLGDMVFRSVNPEMLTLLQQELSNPESQYRTADMPPFWEQEDPLSLGNTLAWLMMPIQEKTGVRGLIQYTYNQADGTCTEKTGIVDNCWVGSGLMHDHYTPEIDTVDAPALADLEWQPLADLPPTEPEDYPDEKDPRYVNLYSEQFLPYQLYFGEADVYEKLTDLSFLSVKEDTQYLYGITSDNVLIQMACDGSAYTPLYTAHNGDLNLLNCQNGTVYFADGDTVIQLDVPGARYRKILTSPNIGYLEIVSTGLYVEVSQGLAWNAYAFDPEANTLTQATPHL